MFSRKKDLFRNDKGQSMVEFALVLPILLLILLSIVEIGWLINAKITITSAAREGARVYAVKGKEAAAAKTQVQAVVDNTVESITKVGSAVVTYTEPTLVSGTDVKMIKVKVRVTVVPLLKLIYKDNIPMEAEISMRIEFETSSSGVRVYHDGYRLMADG
jgi:Flp pilus assembly protein TadG